MVDVIACRHVAWCGLQWTWMRDSGGHRWMRVKKKERKKLKLTGCRWLTWLRACVCGLWTRMKGIKREKKNWPGADPGRDFVQTWMRCVQTQMVVGKDGGKEMRKETHWVASVVIDVQRTDVINNAMWLRKHAQHFSSQLSTPPSSASQGLIDIGHQYWHVSTDKVSFVLLGTNHH